MNDYDVDFIKNLVIKLEKSNKKISLTTLSFIEVEYRITNLFELLMEEEYIKSENEAQAIIRLLISDVLEKAAEPLMKKRLEERVTYINDHISAFKINHNDILGGDLDIKFAESEIAVLGLSYENVSPLHLLDNFISYLNIKLSAGGKTALFKYKLNNEVINIPLSETDKWLYCNNFSEMLHYLSKIMISGLIEKIEEMIILNTSPVNISLKKYINIDILDGCDTLESKYEYLKNIDAAKVGLPLYLLYLLLLEDDILQNVNIMKKISDSLLKTDPDKKDGYDYHLLSNILKSCISTSKKPRP